jgi:hypothetical protein
MLRSDRKAALSYLIFTVCFLKNQLPFIRSMLTLVEQFQLMDPAAWRPTKKYAVIASAAKQSSGGELSHCRLGPAPAEP